MLLYLTKYLAQFESGFNVFNYLTMRAILGALTALVLSFVIGPRMIRRLSVKQIGQPVRDDGPETHLLKTGTPTMGGALILTATTRNSFCKTPPVSRRGKSSSGSLLRLSSLRLLCTLRQPARCKLRY